MVIVENGLMKRIKSNLELETQAHEIIRNEMSLEIMCP